jgi:hypothetical protein
VIIPDENLIKYKEALIMAIDGCFRVERREQRHELSIQVRSAIVLGGAVGIGQEA